MPDKVAMIFEAADGTVENHTYADMKRESDKFANVLTRDRH